MSPKNKKFLLGGLGIALLLAILAPFIASSNPDGLDSTMEKVMQNPEAESTFEAPFSDYTISWLGEENAKFSSIIVLIIGALMVFGIAYGLGAVLKRKKEKKNM